MTDIVFFHGLEGHPNGHKAKWLRAHYHATVPKLDNSVAIQHLHSKKASARMLSQAERLHCLATPLKTAREALDRSPKLVIGSSFGGAILAELVYRGEWQGPCIFLASAHCAWTPLKTLSGPSIFIHGRTDNIIPPEPVAQFVRENGQPHEFWPVDDGHGLRSILTSGVLHRAIRTFV